MPASTPSTATPPVKLEAFGATLEIEPGPAPGTDAVWLLHGTGERFVLDDRSDELWRGFAGQVVNVTGYCHGAPDKELEAPRFTVETMRAADASGPYRSVGPEKTLTGEIVARTAPVGSKLAGGPPELVFVVGDAEYPLVNHTDAAVGPATVVARVLVINPTYAATTGGDRLWLVSVHEAGWVGGPDLRGPLPCR